MLGRLALPGLGLLAIALPGAGAAPAQTLPPPTPPLPGPSQALGAPWCGRLVGGVPLPAAGAHFFTWELPFASSPNPVWRRYGTTRLLAVLRRVTTAYGLAHPGSARVGVADLSLPRGGPFGPRYGGLGHLSHQNGLDADVLYPRRDGIEAPVDAPADVDRVRSQELVNRFVAAGAQYVFVGYGLGLRGPRGVVSAIRFHQDHMHVRIPAVGAVRVPARCPWRPD